MIIDEASYLEHYGILRKSGRYPWGSGGSAEARSQSFQGYMGEMEAKGLSEAEIARGVGLSVAELRDTRTIARNAKKQADIAMAHRLSEKGMSNVAIGERMGLNESSVRGLLAPGLKDKTDILTTTASMLRDQVAKREYIDVGAGVEHHLGLTRTKFNTALSLLKSEGYEVINVQVDQVGSSSQKTLIKVLAPPGTKYVDIVKAKDKIQQIDMHTEDGGRSYLGIMPPLSVSSKRVAIRYAEDGGADADGVVYVRPGKSDISLGGSRYAQVRVMVDGSHYIKGMAIYKDDLPDGVDLLFNTNKSDTGNKLDALKKLKDDPEDPFGAVVRQITKVSADGKVDVTSAMNIVNKEGSWDEWSRSLASQFLSKQKPALAKEQLDVKRKSREKELDDILKLTNPAVKKRLLQSYSDSVDAEAVHLTAAALPRQATQVILPVNKLKTTEIYAPNFRDGERVVLVRYPHGGTFEIPELTVNNRQPDAKKLLGDARDAVGIHSQVAERLSGADFDGDTVLVIPNNSGKIKSSPALDGLKGFDPKASYPGFEGMPKMSSKQKQTEMGKASNLITDMTIKGAEHDEIARAVRHSMVVIDAEKHNLNYRQSAIDNGIPQLKAKYQGGSTKGASTLISRTTSEIRINDRKARAASEGGAVDKETGKKVYTDTGKGYYKKVVNKDGTTKEVFVPKILKSTKGAETDDAHTLSAGTTMEGIYADHSNAMRGLANKARKEMVNTTPLKYSPSAKRTYAKEVATLDSKLKVALRNAPLERQAQVLANTTINTKKAANPGMTNEELKKLRGKAITEARVRMGAGKELVKITPSEWDAIQAGAISNDKLERLLANTDLDLVKEYATPRQATVMVDSKKAKAKALLASGHTAAEVADALGVNVSTLRSSLEEG